MVRTLQLFHSEKGNLLSCACESLIGLNSHFEQVPLGYHCKDAIYVVLRMLTERGVSHYKRNDANVNLDSDG